MGSCLSQGRALDPQKSTICSPSTLMVYPLSPNLSLLYVLEAPVSCRPYTTFQRLPFRLQALHSLPVSLRV